MKNEKTKIYNNEDGQVLIIVVLAIVALMGIAALVVDVGILYVEKANMQNAADAAALAGVQNLPEESAAIATAKNYGKSNGADITNPTVMADQTKIEVECIKSVKYSFARILGFTETSVSARAVAQKTTKSTGGPAFDYTIFNGGTNSKLTMSGYNKVKGNVHSNYKASVSGNAEINGSVTTVSIFEKSGYIVIKGAEKSSVPVVSMAPQFSDAIKNQVNPTVPIYNGNKNIGEYTTITSPIYIKGNLNINGNVTITSPIYVIGNLKIDGLTKITNTSPIYVDGDITIGGNFSYSGNCIFATGNITYSGYSTYANKILYYSEKGNITMSGYSTAHGIIFAPTGSITISGYSINGRVIGETVTLSGNASVISGADDLSVLPPATSSSVKLVE